ncbi:MAG: class I SAM-dependent methyltransferase [Pseudomonadota bacterium]
MVEGGCEAARHALAAALTALALAGAARAQDARQQAPFITTPEEVVERMLALASTGADDFVMDLGSGDGRIVIAAAKKFGARGLGVDIDARLVALSRENARRAGVAERVTFEERDVLNTDLRRATVVTIYLLPFLIDQLQPKLLQELRPGARIVTHAFPMTGWKPDRAETMRIAKRHAGQGDESRIFLWVVPAELRGAWQGRDWRLQITQNFQEIEIAGEAWGRPLAVKEAKLEGTAISFSGEGFDFRGRVGAGRIVGELQRNGGASPLVLTRQ